MCKAAENAPRTLGALVGFHPEISLKLIRRVHWLTKLELRTGFFIELETRMCCLVSRCMELEQQLILPEAQLGNRAKVFAYCHNVNSVKLFIIIAKIRYIT